MTIAKTIPEIHHPQIQCSLTVDELDVVIEKIVDALPASLEDEWMSVLEDMSDSEPLAEEDEDRIAFWAAARVTIAGLIKYGLIAEPLIAFSKF